jgi:branched-subunit amino acid aminotransferase/4-amino-4-deoxychorismate lyase
MIPTLGTDEVIKNLKEKANPFWPGYFAFFSSWIGGITKDPALMVMPMDDHQVHRGDAVFEALKSKGGKIYLFQEHMDRLERSAKAISLPLYQSSEKMKEIISETLRVSGQGNTLIRVFLSRGPGGFTTNPYDSLGSQFYVVITELKPLAPSKYSEGVRIGKSAVPVKEGIFATVKSCNYLPNVLMKKESVDRKLDFTVSFDREGFLAESSTENIAIVSRDGVLTRPPLSSILRGTTMMRCFELADSLGIPTAEARISEADLLSAREVFMIGTTLDVLPVCQYEQQRFSVGSAGAVGSLGATLLKALLEDMR